MSFDHLRRPLVSAAILVVFGLAAASAQDANKPADPTPPAAQGASPDASQGVKSTNDQSGSSNVAPTSSQQQQGEKAISTPSGKAGKEEPSSHAPTQAQGPSPVLVNGALNVPGAPADSQTVPAKFSQRNDAIDKLPIMGMSLGLNDAQKRTIVESVRAADKPVAQTKAKISEELPINVVVHDLPASANDPAMAKLKYVRAQDRVLLIEPTNRIVIGEIAN